MFGKFFKRKEVAREPAALSAAGIGHTADTFLRMALEHHRAGRLTEAAAAYGEVLEHDAENINALHFLGVIAYQQGDHVRAVELITRALSRNAANAPAHSNLGNALAAQDRREEAVACYRRALELDPDYADAHINLGAALGALGRRDEAIASYRKAAVLAPGIPTLHSNLGNMLVEQGDLEAALACYRKAIDLDPEFAAAHLNLGNVLRTRGRPDEALACYRRALDLKPGFAEGYLNQANVLSDQGRWDEAIAAFRRALELKPDFPEAYSGLGNAYRGQGRLEEAIAGLRKAVELKPDFVEAYYSLGHTYSDLDERDRAIECYRKVLSLAPEHAEARWSFVMAQLPAMYGSEAEPARCRAAFSMELDALYRWFDSGRTAQGFKTVGVQQPFCLAYQEENNRDLLARYGRLCAQLMEDWLGRQALPPAAERRSGGPIRVGIVSQHFRNHSVWNAIVKGWFSQMDRERFSLLAFYPGADEDQDTLFARTRASHFEQGKKELRQWVDAILDQRPDVLIYPEIGMDPMTARLASLRLAPVQIAAWGHPETTGLPTIDYYLSAEDFEPDGAQDHYAEKLVALPHLGCFYEPPRIDPVGPDLATWGIDPASTLFLCPGVPFKYAPRHDRVLVEIARKLGDCRLVFFAHRTRSLSEKLRRRLACSFSENRMNIDDHVTFIPWQNWPEFYGWLGRADGFLDTIGFSGFNTAMQAIQCGLPIVTCEGRFMRGRFASGILKRLGLHELVAASEEEYIALAVNMARDAGYREHVRSRIVANRGLVFEDVFPVRALEDFLVKVVE